MNHDDDENQSEPEKSIVKAAKESHAAIDDAVRQHLSDVGVTGIATGWIVIAAITDFDEGTELDGMYETTSDGLSKWSKIGLLTVALDQEKNEEFF